MCIEERKSKQNEKRMSWRLCGRQNSLRNFDGIRQNVLHTSAGTELQGTSEVDAQGNSALCALCFV